MPAAPAPALRTYRHDDELACLDELLRLIASVHPDLVHHRDPLPQRIVAPADRSIGDPR